MLRRILIASAAAAMLLVTFTPTTPMLAVAEVAAIGAVAEATAAALSQFEGSRRRCRSAWRALRLSGWGLSRLRRLSRLRCRCGRGGRRCVGAAAAGAYRGSCYDAYGNYVCAGGYRPY